MKFYRFCNAALPLAVCSFLFLVGCATQRSLYHWGNYPDANYAWLKDEPEDDGEILNAMVDDMEKALSKSHDLPPGFYAHFGLLYMQAGDLTKAVEYFEMEKVAFPESEVFMDFLLKSIQGNRFNAAKERSEVAPEVVGEEAAK